MTSIYASFNSFPQSMNLKVRIAITAAIALATALWSVGEEETIWTMTMSHTRLEIPTGPIFDMRAIEYKSGELTATCTFANIESPKYQPVKVTIEGEWRDGFFWPVVKEQVGDAYLGPWYSIPGEAKKGKLTKVDVSPGQEMRKWRVRLNDFLPYVGNYKVGRVVLASGDFAVFELINVKGGRP
jgi:hypothetical protein